MSNLQGHIRCPYCPHPILSAFKFLLLSDHEFDSSTSFTLMKRSLEKLTQLLLSRTLQPLPSTCQPFSQDITTLLPCVPLEVSPHSFLLKNNHLRSLKGTLDPWECLNAECKDASHKSLFRRHSRKGIFQLQSIQNVVLPLQVKMLSYFTKYVYNFCDYYKKSSSFISILNASFKNLLNIKVKMINDPTVQRQSTFAQILFSSYCPLIGSQKLILRKRGIKYPRFQKKAKIIWSQVLPQSCLPQSCHMHTYTQQHAVQTSGCIK